MAEKVVILTDDGVQIAGVFEPGTTGRAALFLHMMPATKESWAPLALRLSAKGIASLAIDLRGHGESAEGSDGSVLDFRTFTDAQHQAKRLDVDASVQWLDARGFSRAHITLVGASIGANLAIERAAAYGDVPATAALSPGLDYHGVTTEGAAAKMPREQKLLLAASAEDAYSFDSLTSLAAAKADAESHRFQNAGHGTAMFDGMDGFADYLATWIDANVK